MWVAIAVLTYGLLRSCDEIENLDKRLQSKIETVETLSKTSEADIKALEADIKALREFLKRDKSDIFFAEYTGVLTDSVKDIQKQIFHQKHINVAIVSFINGVDSCNSEMDLVFSDPFGDIKDRKDRLNSIYKRRKNLWKEVLNVFTSEDPNSRIESISKMEELSVSEEFQPIMKLLLDKSDSEQTR